MKKKERTFRWSLADTIETYLVMTLLCLLAALVLWSSFDRENHAAIESPTKTGESSRAKSLPW